MKSSSKSAASNTSAAPACCWGAAPTTAASGIAASPTSPATGSASVIRHNHIHDVPLNAGRAESNGMFLDQGSSGFSISHNLIHGTAKSPLRFHQAGPIDVHHNRWSLPADTPELRFNNTPKELIRARDSVLDRASISKAAKAWQPPVN